MADIVKVKRKKGNKGAMMQIFALPLLGVLFGLLCSTSQCFADSINSTILTASTQMPVRGVVRSADEAVISTNLTALITKIGFEEGEPFKSGDLLIGLDCRRLQAELASARAHHREMKVALKAISFLKKRNASSRQDVETSKARTDQAQAKTEAILAQVDRCKIIAPYDGRIAELLVHQHEMSVAGRPLLSIVSRQQPKMELVVPSIWLRWLKEGNRFKFLVDETQEAHMGQVTRLGASVDTVSQTIKIFARFVSSTPNIIPGMSGTAEFEHQRRGQFHD